MSKTWRAASDRPTVLIFRSQSGRTEVAWRPDGSLSLHVRRGHEVLDPAERDRLIAAAVDRLGDGDG